MLQYYKIAGLIVAMDSFGRLEEQAKPYICNNKSTPDIVVPAYNGKLKKIYTSISDDMCEYIERGIGFYKELLKFDGFELHSSAVVVDGKAYCFSADSGTGKSTHTELWLKQFGTKAFILNDDKPALRLEDGVWYAYGTPWSGKHDKSVNTKVPIAGIACLQRGDINEIEPFVGIEAIHAIFLQSNRPKGKEYRIKLMELLDKLITQVPIWKLKCNMEPEAAIVSYEAMSGKKWEGR